VSKKELFAVPRKSKEELREFVNGVADGRIFTANHIAENDKRSMLGSIFMPISLGAFTDLTSDDIAQIGMIYEYLSEAGSRGINDYPVFFSMRMLHTEDWERVKNVIKEGLERRDNIDV